MNRHDLSRRGVLTLAGGAAVAITQGHSAAYAATRPTAKLFTTEVGMGRNVMFLHGWTCDSHDWSAVVRGQASCRCRRPAGARPVRCPD
jgi:pimeloyl-ACP methyl ester carboxylesterase